MHAPGEFATRLQTALGPGYELGDVLGTGGFAVVYRARDVRLKRDVAVKVLRPGFTEAAVVAERFVREAEAVARLRHPNIVPIYSVGGEGATAHYIMPLIEGESLRQRLDREGRLPLADTRRILMDAASALATAHAAGIVHRDVKPENIMLEGEEGRVLLMDFGIAKAMDIGPGTLTATGMIIGTPQYMSPEQASGERSVDFRSDIYSLGIVAYEMLAGRVPFTAEAVVPLLMKHVTEEVPPLARFRSDCPEDLRRVVERCLAKDPDDRWRSAGSLGAAVRKSVLVDVPVRGRDPEVPVPTSSGADAVRRTRIVAVATGAGLALAVAVEAATGDAFAITPLALVVALLLLGMEYGRLVVAGFGWRDVLGRTALAAPRPPTLSDAVALGEYASVVEQVRRDRAAILGMLERLPSAERQALPDLKASVDELVGRVAEMARRLHLADRDLAAEEDAEFRSDRARQRSSLEQRFRASVDALHEIRRAVRRSGGLGLESVARRIEEVLEQLRVVAGSGDLAAEG